MLEIEDQLELLLIVDPGQEGIRIDRFLVMKNANWTRSKIQSALVNGIIQVNGTVVKSSYKVKPRDTISVVDFDISDVDYSEILPEDLPIEIVYEDDDVLVVNKKAGMVVHPAYGNKTGTLLNALAFHFSKSQNDVGVDRLGLVHRIDKDTSGLLIVGKNDFALTFLAKQFYDRTIERKYNCLVWGDFDHEIGEIDVNVGRSLKDRKVMQVFEGKDKGKVAISNYKVLRRFGYVSLLEFKLKTGRTHQIRVHCKYIKHPIFNDITYGGDKILRATIHGKYKQFVENCFIEMPRMALHARSLGFIHPGTKRYMHFETDLPNDFVTLIDRWERYATNVFLKK